MVITVDEYQDYGVVGWTPLFRKNLLYFRRRRVKRWYLPAKLRELRTNETVIRSIVPCIIYEIDERYPLDATIYLLL